MELLEIVLIIFFSGIEFKKSQQWKTVSTTLTTYQLSIVRWEFVSVGVRIKQHLGVGVDCEVRFDGGQVFADEISQGFGLFFRLCSRSAVSVSTRASRCSNGWKNVYCCLWQMVIYWSSRGTCFKLSKVSCFYRNCYNHPHVCIHYKGCIHLATRLGWYVFKLTG